MALKRNISFIVGAIMALAGCGDDGKNPFTEISRELCQKYHDCDPAGFAENESFDSIDECTEVYADWYSFDVHEASDKEACEEAIFGNAQCSLTQTCEEFNEEDDPSCSDEEAAVEVACDLYD